MIDNKPLSGSMLLNLAFELVMAFNQNENISILNSVERIIQTETRKFCDEVQDEAQQKIYEGLGVEKMPYDCEELQSEFDELKSSAMRNFHRKIVNVVSYEQGVELNS